MKKLIAGLLALLMAHTQVMAGETWMGSEKWKEAKPQISEEAANLYLLGGAMIVGAIVLNKQADDIYTRSRATNEHPRAHASAKGSMYKFVAVSGVALAGLIIAKGYSVRYKF